jgi:hypothetical protein
MIPAKPLLQIQLTFKSLLVFLFLFFLMHELHELAHISTGRIVCGCWGTRDFNVWGLCSDCEKTNPYAVIATFAGPVFTFIMLWIGRYWLKYGQSTERRSFGLALIFGNMQFGRMYMAATGSGDEITGLRTLFLNPDHSNSQLIKIITVVIVSVICIPPLIAAYRAIDNKRKILLYCSLVIVPLILDTVIILILLNGLLQKKLLNQIWVMGAPLLVSVWFVLCLLIVITNFKCLTHFARRND